MSAGGRGKTCDKSDEWKDRQMEEERQKAAERRELERLLADLGEGHILYKVKSSTKLLQRQYFLDIKNMVLFYKGSRHKKKNTELPISKIRDVREGEKDFSRKLRKCDKNMCFGLVLKGSHKVMYLMATRQEVRDMWIRGLRYALQMDRLAEQRNEIDKKVRDAFNLADRNNDNALDMDEIMKLLKKLNADIKRKYVHDMFEKANTRRDGKGRTTLDKEEFVRFYNMLTRRLELEEIFLRYSRGKGYMIPKDFLGFFKEGQKMSGIDEDYCRGQIQLFEPEGPSRSRCQLTMVGFQNFLLTEEQFLLRPEHATIYQNMSRPITHYYIASSHNTYLAEDQLKGPSKVEMYISALMKGCRCVELDCWDGPENEPVIYHGYTLTSKILFVNVIRTVKEYAFKASPYPVTLSLENHCSIEQQTVMARHLENILGDMIWAPNTELTAIPTPEQLKNKIIIKGKKLPFCMENPSYMENDDAAEVSDEDESADSNQTVTTTTTNNNNNNNNNVLVRSGSESPRYDGVKADHDHKKIKLCPQLSRLTTMKSVGFKDTDQAAAVEGFFLVFSLGESRMEKLMATSALGINKVTHSKLIRTYPAGSRTDSSNYYPVPMWNHGCQVVALNYQTGGEALQLNHGRFIVNGGCGYVLKPKFQLAEDLFGVLNGTVPRNYSKMLKLTIVSGQQIPKPKDSKKGEVIDPFIKIEVHGAPNDNAEYRTKVINNNGFNPRWYESCVFTVRVPELALVRFVVKDEDRGYDDFIGYYSLPFSSMQEGYRHFPLFDIYGDRYPQTTIFVHIAISNI